MTGTGNGPGHHAPRAGSHDQPPLSTWRRRPARLRFTCPHLIRPAPMNWDDLEQRLRRTWPAIRAARQRADEQLVRIRPVLNHGGAPVDSEDISVVVFGSLARGEWTTGSDLDWTL